MKAITILSVFTFLLNFLSIAQCDYTVAKDTVLCNVSGLLSIGKNTTDTSTYVWSGSYYNKDQKTTLLASDILDDTTIANPKLDLSLIQNAADFTLKVIKAQDTSHCVDSIHIIKSVWTALTMDCKYFSVSKGDTVQLNIYIGGGIAPLTHSGWTPTDGIIRDPNSWQPQVIVDVARTYSVTIKDSVGCEATQNCEINPSANNTPENILSTTSDFVLQPNPTNGMVNLKFKSVQPSISINLFTLSGQKMLSETTVNSDRLKFEITGSTGIYLLEIIDDTGQKTVMKIVKN